MPSGPSILLHGAWAVVQGAETDDLDNCLAALDPDRERKKAFQEDRWDGLIRLYEGNRFPAGLTQHVVDYYAESGRTVKVLTRRQRHEIDASRFTKKYLYCNDFPHELYWYQEEAVQKIFDHVMNGYSGCCIKSPTGSGKSIMIACVARYLYEEFGWRSLILVPKVGLADQAVRLLRRLFGSDVSVGQCGDGKETVGSITVANSQTLIHYKRSMRKVRGCGMRPIPANPVLVELMANHEVLFLDETHHASSTTWHDISMDSKAKVRIGFSGTPLVNKELRDMKMIGATGPVIFEVPSSELIESGHVARPTIFIVLSDNASGPALSFDWKVKRHADGSFTRYRHQLNYKEAYIEGVVKNEYHNTSVLRATKFFVDNGLQTLILARHKEHWLEIRRRLEESGVMFRAVWGATDTTERDMVKQELNDRTIQCVLASTIWDEGEDVPGIEAIVLAEGVKINTTTLQRIGRGMRPKVGMNRVFIADIVPTCHTTLMNHGLERCKTYDTEGFETVLVDRWPDKDDNDFDYDLFDLQVESEAA